MPPTPMRVETTLVCPHCHTVAPHVAISEEQRPTLLWCQNCMTVREDDRPVLASGKAREPLRSVA